LSDSQSDGIIMLLLKPQKDLLLPSSYRPITLLKVDYKILASVSNFRMKQYLNDLIKPGQNGFIKGRHIGLLLIL